MYAVIDLETTGFSPRLHDRVVEVAVVHVDEAGRVEREWCSLLNPERDLGPQHVHGISAADAAQAPRFADIVDELIAHLSGRTLVSHNWAFDSLFLSSELERLGHPVPLGPDSGVCTMQWAATFLPGASRSLLDCCRSAGVPLRGVHSASGDAHAAAALLAHYLRVGDGAVPWTGVTPVPVWPTLPPPAVRVPRRTRAGFVERTPDDDLVARVMSFMPRVQGSHLADPYLAVLDQALADRYLSSDELAAMWALAEHLRLDRGDVLRLHLDYLNALARLALADERVTEEELHDLGRVARLLGLPESTVQDALDAATTSGNSSGWSLEIGDAVVFTGSMPEPREVWFARAAEHGYVPRSTVTKDVRLVVAADPASLSGKAKKARGYGITVVGVDAFRSALGYPEPDHHVGESPIRRGVLEARMARALQEDGLR